MGKFFRNQQDAAQLSPREILQNKYNSARANLLLVIAFTVINIIMLLTDSSSYFLFSLNIPYMFMLYGMLLTGRIPELFTEGEYAMTEFLPDIALVIAAVIAAVIILLFLLCWIFSKKNRVGWIIAALVLFSLDTLYLLLCGITADSVIDIIFHIWVIVSLASGISAYKKLKALPPEEEVIETTGEVVNEVFAEVIDEIPAEVDE